MKTLIVYASRYGCTKECAEGLSKLISGDVTVININNKVKEIKSFDTIIIGGSIYMGKIQKDISNFCKQNKNILLRKKIGLFICCYTPIEQTDFINNFYDSDLLRHSKINSILGGEMRYDKMNFFYKKLFQSLNKIEGFKKGVIEPSISQHQIKKFSEIINK
ncbi:MAG: flavodoxin domain-containing protein [Clostridium sp.]